MKLKKINKKSIFAKDVLIRLDLNVPIEGSKIKEDFKIKQCQESLSYLLKNDCNVIIMSHLGQPKASFDKKYSLKVLVPALTKILSHDVEFLDYTKYSKFDAIRKQIKEKKAGGSRVFLLDNIRFFEGESRNCSRLGKSLASLADVYINEAFAVSHRANSSVSSVRKYIDSYAGFLMEKEILNLNKVLKPKKPLVVVMGGAKVSSKMPIIDKLYDKASHILLGGALINNFYKAQGLNVGDSLLDPASEKIVLKYLKMKKIVLPIDLVVASGSKKTKKLRDIDQVQDGESIYDIGPETISLFSSYIKKAATIVWNGPMGMFEDAKFKQGTIMMANQIATRSKGRAFGVVGGGETVEALNLSSMSSYVDWVSTGGGAMLDYLSGKKMPGIE